MEPPLKFLTKFLFIAIVILLTSRADADIFNFTDIKGFETCLQTQQLKEIETVAGSQQEHWFTQIELQQRCIQNAIKILKSGSFSSANILDYVKTTKRESAHEQSLDLIQVLVEKNLKECNNMEVYSVVKKALSHPQDYPSVQGSYFEKTKQILKFCMKDIEFKKDFIEEKDSTDQYLADNVCQVLLTEKIIKSCAKK